MPVTILLAMHGKTRRPGTLGAAAAHVSSAARETDRFRSQGQTPSMQLPSDLDCAMRRGRDKSTDQPYNSLSTARANALSGGPGGLTCFAALIAA